MFHRILVPLDGSFRAEQALPIAARIARASGGTITLLRVAHPALAIVPPMIPNSAIAETTNNAAVAIAQNYLEGIRHSQGLADVHTETEAVVGQAAATILFMLDVRPVDLIVMCSHGYNGLKRLVMGSIAENVARHATVPLLLLRDEGPGLTQARSGGPSSMSILVPLDGSVRAEAAIGPAMQLIEALSAPARGLLRLARVVILPDANKTSLSERETIMQEAKTYLSSIAERIQAERVAGLNLAVSWCVTIDDDLAGGIVRMAEVGECVEGEEAFPGSNLIGLTTHGYGEQHQLGLGSVTGRVLSTTRLPLLIVRPPNRAHAGQ